MSRARRWLLQETPAAAEFLSLRSPTRIEESKVGLCLTSRQLAVSSKKHSPQQVCSAFPRDKKRRPDLRPRDLSLVSRARSWLVQETPAAAEFLSLRSPTRIGESKVGPRLTSRHLAASSKKHSPQQ
eukprot:CCRYP_000164-RA/>CCRYP_000164-RA protein AED:0.42 eAED:0.42 QI:29/1/1/1/0/0/2/0/126